MSVFGGTDCNNCGGYNDCLGDCGQHSSKYTTYYGSSAAQAACRTPSKLAFYGTSVCAAWTSISWGRTKYRCFRDSSCSSANGIPDSDHDDDMKEPEINRYYKALFDYEEYENERWLTLLGFIAIVVLCNVIIVSYLCYSKSRYNRYHQFSKVNNMDCAEELNKLNQESDSEDSERI